MDQKPESYPKRSDPVPLTASDLFRPTEYISGCRAQLLNDFPRHWESTIKAVMAECNNDYYASKQKLLEIPTNSWLSHLFSFAQRKRLSLPEMAHPDLVLEMQQNLLKEILQIDNEIAKEMNRKEYEEEGQSMTCNCCFSDFAFEDLGCCSHGHLFCQECLNRLVSDAVFGQSQVRGQKVKCIHLEGCSGHFSQDMLQRLVDTKVLDAYESMIAEQEILKAGLEVVKCPFCSYAEEYIPESPGLLQQSRQWLITHLTLDTVQKSTSFFTFCISMALTVSFSVPAFAFSLFLAAYLKRFTESRMFYGFFSRLKRLSKSPSPPVLNCKNPKCLKPSCLRCQSIWEPLHICHEKEQEDFRLYVERAMSNAMVRMCPNCQIGFSKADGCNKITVSVFFLYLCASCPKHGI